ncbi:MAG: helix-turn-helix transcriptional regulator [Zoogloea sp.]|uniref:helix-turn-helix domain-containing protein n=1 Tax=Zoogloea sp. TaxID=49181 RepID=UPI002608CE6F|nr:helix-turn-helix transcriptional regulator [Zoogloea sp.]MDD3325655.1 helix-turn-helix transcriptional regulator [Zoogloea sp.]
MITPDRSPTLLEIAERIAGERNRLGMSQEEFGRATQTHRNTVRHYETGERKPDPLFLAALENIGGDVAYVLTGARRHPQPEALQSIVGKPSAEKIADAVLAVGDKRSAAYRRGLVDVLAFRLEGQRIHCPYQAGTAEFDAYFAGNERGHFQWRLMVDGAWKPN